MNALAREATEREIARILKLRTGSSWKLERLGGPTLTPDGKIDTTPRPTEVKPASDITSTATNENAVKGGR